MLLQMVLKQQWKKTLISLRNDSQIWMLTRSLKDILQLMQVQSQTDNKTLFLSMQLGKKKRRQNLLWVNCCSQNLVEKIEIQVLCMDHKARPESLILICRDQWQQHLPITRQQNSNLHRRLCRTEVRRERLSLTRRMASDCEQHSVILVDIALKNTQQLTYWHGKTQYPA